MTPDELRFTDQHEWVKLQADGSVIVGITDFAQDKLGDIVFVALPEVGMDVSAGDSLGEVESTKSVSEIYAPISGEVILRNDAVETAPETINEDPQGQGWLVAIKPANDEQFSGLLTADEYQSLLEG